MDEDAHEPAESTVPIPRVNVEGSNTRRLLMPGWIADRFGVEVLQSMVQRHEASLRAKTNSFWREQRCGPSAQRLMGDW